MIDIFDYNQGIHPNCGIDVTTKNDTIVTPFFTREYCDVLVQFAKRFENNFIHTSSFGDPYSSFSLTINKLSPVLYKCYCYHFMDKLIPVINDYFKWDRNIQGFFSPFINKFDTKNQSSMELHNESSMLSLVVKLNDDYEGGALTFPRQSMDNSDLGVGDCIIFPGSLTHPHTVLPITKGERYTLIGFTTPPSWSTGNVMFVEDLKKERTPNV